MIPHTFLHGATKTVVRRCASADIMRDTTETMGIVINHINAYAVVSMNTKRGLSGLKKKLKPCSNEACKHQAKGNQNEQISMPIKPNQNMSIWRDKTY